MTLLTRILTSWRAKRSAAAERDLREWYEACGSVVAACQEGLRNWGASPSDIGVTLDKVDRTLFRVRDAGSGAQEAVRRGHPQLALRIRNTIQAVVELRNETARFLIRAQGPMPPSLNGGAASGGLPHTYRQAYQAPQQAVLRQAQTMAEDLHALWAELQPVLRGLADTHRQAGSPGRRP